MTEYSRLLSLPFAGDARNFPPTESDERFSVKRERVRESQFRLQGDIPSELKPRKVLQQEAQKCDLP